MASPKKGGLGKFLKAVKEVKAFIPKSSKG
jgi:hypothetical protein